MKSPGSRRGFSAYSWPLPWSGRPVALGQTPKPRTQPVVLTKKVSLDDDDVYGLADMKALAEGVLAVVVIVGLGGIFYLTTGASSNVDATTTTFVAPDLESVARGQLLANERGCLSCHTTDGTPSVGPTWKGLAGSSRPLTSGDSLVADDTYLLESIVDPAAKVVVGFDPIMPPDFRDVFSDQELNDLVGYIRSLS